MDHFTYTIGEMYIIPELIKCVDDDAYEASEHLFVVELQGHTATIYISTKVSRHMSVAEKFSVDKSRIAGGGSVYTDPQDTLVLDDFSVEYGAIPKYAAAEFAKLLAVEMRKLGINVSGTRVNPYELNISKRWPQR